MPYWPADLSFIQNTTAMLRTLHSTLLPSLRALLATSTALALTGSLVSCDESPTSTPEWQSSAKTAPLPASEPLETNTALSSSATHSANPDGKLTFLAYNIKNYLTMSRRLNGKNIVSSKPEKEIQQLVEIIVKEKPDLVGISEIGTPADLKDLQQRLTKSGLKLPHSYHTGGSDEVRHLGLLSRFPITKTSKAKIDFQLNGKTQQVRRGILDATVDSPVGKLRLIGLHFKSKREIPGASQEMIRQSEALTVRKHVNQILENRPQTKLVVFGDLNDTIRSKSVKTVQGAYQSKTALRTLHLKDDRGHSWTHYWSYQDVYSRFDYVMVSKPLFPFVRFNQSSVIDPPPDSKASDHRPLRVQFQTPST